MAVPSWVQRLKSEDARFRYYVGRAAQCRDETVGFNEATSDAYAQAIRENFGVNAQIQSQSYESSNDFTTTKRFLESSRKVEVRDFEQVDFFKEEIEGGKLNVWVLYRYRKVAITKEKDRLSRLTIRNETTTFSEAGDPNDVHLGTLEVRTVPSGASIFVDDVHINFLETPLRLVGRISLGRHRIRISHPSFEEVDENVIISPNQTTRLNRLLKPAYGVIKVATSPSNAFVTINGRPYGKTPTDEIKIPAGITAKLELSHPEAERYLQELVVGRGTTKLMDIPLPLKLAGLVLDVRPSGSDIIIDGLDFRKTLKAPVGKVPLDAGIYEIEVSRKGFVTKTVEVELRGGERKTIPSIELEPKKDSEYIDAVPVRPESRLPFRDFVVDINLQGATRNLANRTDMSFGGGVSLQWRFIYEAGVKCELFLFRNMRQDGNSTSYTGGGTAVRFGLPLFPFGSGNFQVSPEFIYLASKDSDRNLQASSTESAQTGFGASIAWISPTTPTHGAESKRTESISSDGTGISYRIGFHRLGAVHGIPASVSVMGALGFSFGL